MCSLWFSPRSAGDGRRGAGGGAAAQLQSETGRLPPGRGGQSGALGRATPLARRQDAAAAAHDAAAGARRRTGARSGASALRSMSIHFQMDIEPKLDSIDADWCRFSIDF